MTELIVVGIDSSSSCVGWAILSRNGARLIDSGKIIPDKKMNFLEKCRYIIKELSYKLDQYEIDNVAIEQLNCFKNGKTVRVLAGVFAIIKYHIFTKYKIMPVEINTKHNKLMFSGNGKAEKEEMIKAVNERYKTKFVFKKTTDRTKSDDDVCDAISVAYTLIKDLENETKNIQIVQKNLENKTNRKSKTIKKSV